VAIYLIDGTTPLPESGDTNWGTTLNAAINAIDGRFTYQSPTSIPATKALASGIVGTTLASNVVTSSLTSVGTLSGLNVSGTVTITGDLTVNGTTTTINTSTINVSDNIIVLNNDVTGSPTENAGIEVERGTSTNVLIRWNETSDKWEITNDGSTYRAINDASDLIGTTLASGITGSSLTSVGTITSGVWNGTAIDGARGGTGVANSGKTITVSGNTVIGSSTHTVTFSTSGNTTVTLPTTGTLATTGNLSQFSSTTSSQLAGVLSDETGTGSVVFSTSPQITTSLTTDSTTFSLINTTATTVNFAGAATAISIGAVSGTTTVNNDLSVTGNLTVNGTTTTLNTTDLNVEDNIILLNSGVTGSPTLNAGIQVERGTSANVEIRWNETDDKWEFTSDGTNYRVIDAGSAFVTENLPVNPQTGDLWYESDTGGFFVYYDGYWIEPSIGATALSPLSFFVKSGTSHTLELADKGIALETTNSSPVTITVPLNSSVAFPNGTQISVFQNGSGQVTFAAEGGVTINSDGGKLKIASQYSVATLVKRDTNTWYLFGNLSA
jgi:hypothetical protein